MIIKRFYFYIVLQLSFCCMISSAKNPYRSELLRNVAEVCGMGCREITDCQLLRQGAQEFNIAILDSLANMRENRVLDKESKGVRSALASLSEYATKQFGTGSREEVICNRFYLQAIANTEKDLVLQTAKDNADKAERLYQSTPKDIELKILSLVTRIERFFIERQHDIDNPTRWYEVFEIEKALEPEINGKHPASIEWIDLCLYLSMWKADRPGTDVMMYADYAFNKLLPKGTPVIGFLDNGYVNNAEGWARHAYETAKAAWGEYDIRTIHCELQLLTAQMTLPTTDYEKNHNRLQEMQRWLEGYLPYGDLLTQEVELQKWDYDVFYGEKLYETGRYLPLLFKAEQFYGKKNIAYLNNLHRIVNQQMQVDQTKAADLLREEEQLLEELYPDRSDMYWIYQIGTAYTRFALSASQPDKFQQFLSNLHDYYKANHQPRWSSIYIGRNLCEIYRQMQHPDEAVSVYSIVVEDIEKLVGNHSALWTFVRSSLFGYLSETNNSDCLKRASTMADDVIQEMLELDYPVAGFYRIKANTAFALGQEDDCIEFLRQGIKACTKPADGLNRCAMQMELGNRLYSRNGNFTMTPEIQTLFEESIPFFMKYREMAEEFNLNCYQYMADYYIYTKQYDKAEEAYLMGMQHLEMKSAQFNYIYANLATGLFGLYAYHLNNLDKADELIELCIKTAKSNYNFDAHLFIANLLFCRYELLTSKNVDVTLQMAALTECLNQLQLAKNMNEGDEETLRSMSLKLLFSMGNYIPDFSKAMKEGEKALHSPDETIRSTALKTQDTMKTYRQMFDSLLDVVNDEVNGQIGRGSQADDQRLAECYQYLGNHYLYLCGDTIEAEKYYELLSHTQAGRSWGLAALASLEESRGQYGEAAKMLEEIISGDVYETFTSLQNKAHNAYRIFENYYRMGQYDKALVQARRFADYKHQLALLNFDLMTQTEREVFVEQGGTGGAPLYSLLPIYKQELAAESFNAILSEKGLLLRASERIKKALSQINDSALIAKQDSLNRLQTYYKTLNVADYILSDVKNNELVKCRQQIEALERSIIREAAKYIVDMNTPDWKSLQSVLKHDEVAVEYVISDTILIGALLVSSHGDPQYIGLVSPMELWRSIKDFNNLDAQQKAKILYQEDRVKLYDKLWKPLEDRLRGKKTVFFSPSGFMNDLAFSAFRCPDGSYLSERYDIHQMLSTGDLVALRHNPSSDPVRAAALYGSVFYSPEHENMSQQNDLQDEHRGAVNDAFNYLPFTKNEITRIEDVLRNKHVKVECYTGFTSTEGSMRAMSGNSPEILHLSTHGFFITGDKKLMNNKFLARFPAARFSSMQRSGLALVGANRTWEGATDKPEECDGILTANEVATLDLGKTRLAVLSACQTAVGEYSLEGVYGMHRGFKQAGVRSILASLWNVNDKSTARLMELFYGKWLSGTPMQQSLHEAVRELRKEYPSPFYWAPFVLMDAED